MAANTSELQGYILQEIKSDSFISSSIISRYTTDDIIEAVVAILDDKSVAGKTDTVDLSEAELQNIYLLVRTLVVNDIPSASGDLENKKDKSSHNKRLDPKKKLEFMLRLHPAY